MDSSTRIKVLGRLAQSTTAAADQAITRACEQALTALADESDYETLEFSLDVLLTVGFRRSRDVVSALNAFLRLVETRALVHSEELGALMGPLSRYRNAYMLMSKGIAVLSTLRYLETPAVLDCLLWASRHKEESVRQAAVSSLSELAKYNISVYFGDGTPTGRGIAATPQLQIIGTLEKKDDNELRADLRGVLTLLERLLSTSMEAARWSSTAVTLSRAVVPADEGVVTVRKRSIDLVKRLYGIADSKSEKLSALRTINIAARGDVRGAADKYFATMITENSLTALTFFADIAEQERDLQIIQKIEHDSYWIHYHSASEDSQAAALKVKAVIDKKPEYTIYKTLVGFEGIFGDWSRDKKDESFALGSRDSRLIKARDLASKLAEDGFDVWRHRILDFAKTESNDLATFPVFYEFLSEVSRSHPGFALDLLVKDSEQLLKFLIPIIRGLWESERRDELLHVMRKWVRQTQPEEISYLYASAKLFLSTKQVDVDLLKQVLAKAVELKDSFVVRQVASVAIARSADDDARDELKAVFLQALSHLTELGDANWVREIWFRTEAKEMVKQLSHGEQRAVLKNLLLLSQIDYEAEDVLAVIAEEQPREVVEFLCERVYEPQEEEAVVAEIEGSEYEDLPYQFHSLNVPLSADPNLVVQKVLEHYRKDSSLFVFKGAKLLQIIFPDFPETFQRVLLRLVREGGDADLEFVANILRAYNGEAFIQPVAKELVKRITPGGDVANEVEVALQSTGVVCGEYGLAEAYERKRLEVLDWLQDPDGRVRAFAIKYIADLESMRDRERVRANESIALRKFEYGEE